jgi:hypothetical protein
MAGSSEREARSARRQVLVWLTIGTLAAAAAAQLIATRGRPVAGDRFASSIVALELARSPVTARLLIEGDRSRLRRQIVVDCFYILCYAPLWWGLSRRLNTRLGAAVIVGAACDAASNGAMWWSIAHGARTAGVMFTRGMSLIAWGALALTWAAMARGLLDSVGALRSRPLAAAAAAAYGFASAATLLALVVDEALMEGIPWFVAVALLLQLLALAQDQVRSADRPRFERIRRAGPSNDVSAPLH